MQKYILVFITLVFTFPLWGSTIGSFSVSPTTKVTFAPGNLQYQASTNTWRFAEHQYDYVGDANTNISATYDGWIDLFGWGTSGYNDKYPYMTSPTATDYGDGDKDIAGTNYDWGVYNQIGDDPAGTWRTLTQDEWWYLINTRTNSDNLAGLAIVNEIAGLIILPDNWEIPSDLSFTAGAPEGFSTNTYTLEQWALMEAAGACFFPAAGYRESTTIKFVQTHGYFWSSTQGSLSHKAGSIYFEPLDLFLGSKNFANGQSVRLVHQLAEENTDVILPYDATSLTPEQEAANPIHLAYPTAMQDKMPTIQCGEAKTGGFSVSATEHIQFAPGNLQYQASTNTWRFAEHQYDYVGDANANISATYDGWIDLFGWGTSGFNSKYPYMTSVTNSDYVNGTIDITHTPYDWGVYNQIGDDPAGTWRTLTKDEWVYLCNTRPDASNLVGLATVNEVNGLIILPDNWALPSGLSFNALLDFNENIYTPEQWEKMEAAGACFLPAAGYRNSTNVFKVQEYGSYWSSSHKNSDKAYNLDFSNSALDPQYSYIRIDGQSVRLVRTIQK